MKSKYDPKKILERGDSKTADEIFQKLEERQDYGEAARLAREFGMEGIARRYDELAKNPWTVQDESDLRRGLIRRAIEDY